MGYGILKLDDWLVIRAASFASALECIRTLDRRRFPTGEHPGGIESHLANSTVEKLRAALQHFDWNPRFDEQGDICSLDHIGINLGWSEELFECLAPHIGDGSFVEILGEDRNAWRWKFADGTMIRVPGRLTFEDDELEDEPQ